MQDVLSMLQAGAQGKFVPPAPAPAVAEQQGGELPAWAIGGDAQSQPQLAQAQKAPVPDVLSMLQAGAQGKFVPAIQPSAEPDRSTIGGILKQIPSGLYAGVADLANLPGEALNAVNHGLVALGANPDGGQEFRPIVNPNPLNVPQHGTAERAVYAGARAIPGLFAMTPEGEAAAMAAEAALPSVAGKAVGNIARNVMKVPVTPTVAASVGAGAAAGQAAQELAPNSWATPYLGLGANLAVGGGVALGKEALGAGLRGLGNLGMGDIAQSAASKLTHGRVPSPYTEIGGVRATSRQAAQAAGVLAAKLGPEGVTALQNVELAPVTADEAKARLTRGTVAETPEAGITPVPERNAIPGYEPTLAQAVPTPGAVGLEKAFRVARPEPFLARAQEQNAAQVGTIDQMGGAGQPLSVGQALVQHLNALEAANDAGVAQATQERANAAAALPPGKTAIPGGATAIEQTGADIRGQAMVNRAATAARVAQLKDAIDPTGNAGARSAPFKEAVEAPYDGLPQSAAPPTAGEQGIRQAVGKWGTLVPVSELFALRERVNGELSAALSPTNPDRVAAARLMQVKNGLDTALQQAVDQHVAFEDQAVATGQMPVEATIKAQLEAMAARERAAEQQAAWGLGGGSPASGSLPDRGLASSAGPVGAMGARGSESGLPPGNQGAPSPTRSFSPDELASFKRYLSEAAQLKRNFDEGPVGETLAYGEHPTGAQVAGGISRARGGFAKSDAEVVGQILRKGVTEAAAVRRAENAGISADTLTGALADELRDRALRPDGTFDTAEYAKFAKDHRGALHVFPDVAAQFENAARAQQTVVERQAAAKQAVDAFRTKAVEGFLNEPPDEAMRRVFEIGDSGKNIADLLDKAKHDPEVLKGLRRLAADYIIKKLSSSVPEGASPRDYLKPYAFQQWVDTNRDAIRRLYGGQGIRLLEQIAANLRRQFPRTVATPGSDTVPKALGLAEHGLAPEHGKSATSVIAALLGEHLGEAAMGGAHGGLIGAGAALIAKPLLAQMRRRGLETKADLLTEAILHPTTVGRQLLAHASPTGAMSNGAGRRIGDALRAAAIADYQPH